MKDYLVSHDGRKCRIDLDNPIVMVKNSGHSHEYGRGALVYPISSREGEEPGSHFSKGWMTVSTLDAGVANFLGVEIGKSAVTLKDLLEVSGKRLKITYNANKTGLKFAKNGERVETESAINELLECYGLMRLPEDIRGMDKFSKAVSFSRKERESGVIFDSLEELARALKFYETGSLESSRATEEKLFEDTWKSRNPEKNVDDPSLFRGTLEGSFMELAMDNIRRKRGSLADQMIVAIFASKGNFRKSFDYDGMGSPFFKTSVEVNENDGHYLLRLWAAYVGDEPEIELAKKLKKDRGLAWTGSEHFLSPVAEGWVGVDLEEVFKGSAFTPGEIESLAKKAAGEGTEDTKDDLVINANGMNLKMHIALAQANNSHQDVIRFGRGRLFLNTEGSSNPSLNFSFSHADKREIATSERKTIITKFRDELSSLVHSNLSR